MGDYDDYCMNLPQEPGTAVAGICHVRRENAKLPPVWLVYLAVENLHRSLEACTSRGGKLIDGPKHYGNSARYAIIQGPAGAVAALFSEAPDPNPQ